MLKKSEINKEIKKQILGMKDTISEPDLYHIGYVEPTDKKRKELEEISKRDNILYEDLEREFKLSEDLAYRKKCLKLVEESQN